MARIPAAAAIAISPFINTAHIAASTPAAPLHYGALLRRFDAGYRPNPAALFADLDLGEFFIEVYN